MMTETVQNNSLTFELLNGALIARVLFVCAVVLLLFFGLASKAGADPVTTDPSQTSLTATATASVQAGMPATSPITYSDASCSICHFNDVQLEHQTRGGCTKCHQNDSYTKGMPAINFSKSAGKKGCGVDNKACHSQSSRSPWHGYDPVAVTAAHSVSVAALPSDGAAASCSGYGLGLNCHATGSTQSNFIFGTMDIASAHADYSHAVSAKLTNPDASAQISPAITASADACGLCHDKNSTEPDVLKPAVAKKVIPAQKSLTFSCLTCHDSGRTYVTTDAYPSELQTIFPGQSRCFMTSDPALLASVASQSGAAQSGAGATSSQASIVAPSAGLSTNSQLDSLLTQLSPDLQAQLSGVAPTQQQQLTAGVLTSQGETGIPLSALPATSISSAILFK